jgi:D-alanyl-lipoteichoic acid acyltransferase DltB (MBOAT superfamily)
VLFNSYPFVFAFLPAVLLGFALCTRWAAKETTMLFLIGASLVFYGWWNWRYLFLLLSSMTFNYAWAALLRRRAAAGGPGGRRFALAVGIAVNLGLLGYFKYANFFVDNLNAAFGRSWQLGHVVLPLAISFFTFEQITYLVEAQGGQAPAHTLLSYGVFMTFFPRLIAGPIVRPQQLLPQLNTPRPFVFDPGNVATGLFIFAIGLFKKVIIADSVAVYVGPIFDRVPLVTFSDGWGAAIAFALQLYFDFSGYCDMAVGLGRMFGIHLPENFDSPYRARDIPEFWQRWHITLSTFLRDYVYVPLGGNRRGPMRRAANVCATMLLGGLWHGAQWTFVAWGGIHGVFLMICQLWRRRNSPLPGAVAWLITFIAIIASHVVFRSVSFERAGMMLSGMIGAQGFAWRPLAESIGGNAWMRLLLVLGIVLLCPNRRRIMEWQWPSPWLYAASFALLAGLSILRLGDPSPFLYFQF